MQILNVAGYKFVTLSNLLERKQELLDQANNLELKGTILLSTEGINLNLAGNSSAIFTFIDTLKKEAVFSDMTFRETFSTAVPFNKMRVKIKKEIITLRQPDIDPVQHAAPHLSPQEFKQWLDEGRDITILDTRNTYEMELGAFKNAQNLQLNDFGEFPAAIEQVSREKPIVMYCTGGIRCEKAAGVMLKAGYKNVYQLQGGILNYFTQVGADHYEGQCFVFDQRVAVSPPLS